MPAGTAKPALAANTRYQVIAVAVSADTEDLMIKRADGARDAWATGGDSISAGVGDGLATPLLVLAPDRQH